MLTIPVDIVHRTREGAEVFLVGDFPDWSVRVPMLEEEPGFFKKRLHLEPGLYRYKLIVDGAWIVDMNAAIVDTCEGTMNGVIAVGAGLPPLHFAPDRRHVGILEDGRLLVRAELDVSALDRVHALLLVAGDKQATLPLRVRGVRENRAFIEVAGRVHTKLTHLAFLGAPAHVFSPPPARTAAGAPPSWLDGAVVYGIFLDRWRRGSASGAERRMLAPTTPSTPFVFYGGDLEGVRESLPYLEDLGVTAIALSPLHTSESPHRYDGRDLMTVDPRLGGERALTALLVDAHARGLRVIVDASVTHVSEKHAAFQDVLAHQERSAFASWFRIKRSPVVARDGETFAHYYNCADQPWLDLADGSPAREHAIAAAEKLASFGVDGLRLDAMDDAPPSFWSELRARVRERNPNLLLLGEIVGDNLWTRAEERGVDCATDFRIRDALIAFIGKRSMDAADFVEALVFASHRTGAFDPSFRVGFLDNHDTARFLSLAPDDAALRRALAILLFLEETVWIGYGTEAHLAARRGDTALDNAWLERLAMPPLASVTTPTWALLRRLCALRRAFTTNRAPLEIVRAQGTRLVLARGPHVLEVDRDEGEPTIASSSE